MAPNVLVVSNFFPPEAIGGAEIVAHRQALALKRRGATVTVLGGCVPRDDFPSGALELERVDGLTVYRVALRSLEASANFHWDVGARRLAAVLSSVQPEIVHFHNVAGLGANLIPTARRFGAKTVVTLHDHWGFCFKNTRLRNNGRVCEAFEECAACAPTIAVGADKSAPMRLRRDYVSLCLAQADRLISPSGYLAEAYAQAGLPEPMVLSNGIPCDQIHPRPKPHGSLIAFVTFGYLGAHKGIPVLLKAAERLAQDRDLLGRWSLTVAGHGHLESELRAQIEDGRFAGAVQFAGQLSHQAALDLLAESHVLVLPSAWPENQPVTLLEAVASGTAQIASRTGGNPELVVDGRSGLLFPPNDDQALAIAMREFIVRPELAHEFGDYNASRRMEFDEAHSIDAIVDLYATLSKTHASADDIIVLCAGPDWSPDVELMVHHLHLLEETGRRIRLVWHAWADAEDWVAARLFWAPTSGPAETSLFLRALRQGTPVLAPRGSAFAELGGAAVTAYDNLLQAAAWITALQDIPIGDDSGVADRTARARLLGEIVTRSSFHLEADKVG